LFVTILLKKVNEFVTQVIWITWSTFFLSSYFSNHFCSLFKTKFCFLVCLSSAWNLLIRLWHQRTPTDTGASFSPGVNFINIYAHIFRTNFWRQSRNVTRKSCWNDVRTKNSYVKMLMKLTIAQEKRKKISNKRSFLTTTPRRRSFVFFSTMNEQ